MTNVIEPNILHLEEDAEMPNHPSFPVLIYAGVIGRETAGMDRTFEECFARNGWRGIWRNGIFGYHHFHPDAHEALGVARGSAELQLGGESGERLRLEAGDLLVLPAGTGHKRLSASADFLVVGAYPAGQENYAIRRSKVPRDVVAQVQRPSTDPFYGEDGPLTRLW